jgi:hypothetical protein
VRHLRHYHDRFIAGNPKGRTVFYEPWLGIPGRTDVARWVNYERSAAPVWRCVVARVNHSLAAEGRSDRIESLPAGLALAELVERATRGPGLEGISEGSSTATIKKLFTDDVHVTPLAFYYLALVSVGFIAERSPQGASTPEGLGAAQASTLQRLASDFVTRHRREARPPDAESCSKALDSDFLNLYFDHRRDEYWAQLDGNALVKTWKRMKSEAGLRRRLNSHNPLAWVPGAKDTGDWFAPP